MELAISLKKKQELIQSIESIVSESGLTYKDAMSALSYVACSMREKGNNLLDELNIQEIAGK